MNPEGAHRRVSTPEGSSANSADVRLVSAETETIMVQKTILRQDCLPFVFFSGLFLVRRLCQILFVLLRCVLWRGVLLYFLLFLFFSSIRSSLLLDRGVNVPYLHTYIHTYSTPGCDGQNSPWLTILFIRVYIYKTRCTRYSFVCKMPSQLKPACVQSCPRSVVCLCVVMRMTKHLKRENRNSKIYNTTVQNEWTIDFRESYVTLSEQVITLECTTSQRQRHVHSNVTRYMTRYNALNTVKWAATCSKCNVTRNNETLH